jgi:GT2 family glycosyltransferase
VTEIRVVPLDWLGRLRLAHFERELVRQLRRRFGTAEGAPALDLNGLEQIRERIASLATVSEPAAITTVHLFVTSKSNLFIIEIAQLVCAGFRDAGLAAELFVDRIPAEETPNDTLQIVVTPHEFYNLFFSPQFSVEEVRRRSRNLYLLGTEQPESGWFHSNLIVAPYARAILDINLLGVQGYRARGLRCVHLPLGYHPMLAATSEPSPNERDFDLCLLASMTERREQFLAEHADFFSARRCHLRLVPLGFAKTETTKSYLSTERRNSILQRSKILLNVHYSDLRYFEWHRMLIGLANGCCIITETCEGYAPLVPGKHFVMVEKELLIKTCEYYLVHPEEREAIARAGHDFVREHLTQAANCQHCLEQITRGNFFSLGKFPEQTDPTPEGLPAELSSNHRGPSGLRHALVQDLRALFTPTDRVPLTVVQASTDEKAIAVIEERRRGFAERFACQEELEKDGGTPWKIKDNAPYATHPLPTISVVITLYNYERYIRSCVESVEQALRASIPGGIEILIVDDASTDRSLAQAEEVQRKSPLPLRIVAKKFNTGLADARTVGLRIARAPYAFIMDADNLIFPHALELLHAAITKNHTAAAYSILCRFRGQPDNRSGLLSYYDWDPRMLVEHPYIDAMALFDRAQLVALGGYDNDLFKVGWFGWEDYELWLRMAAAHLEATLVPNILCLYRHHESAMSNTTNLFEVDLVRHLLKRYQPLIDEYAPKKRVFGVEWERLA